MKFRDRQQRLVCSRTTSSEDDDRVVLMAPVQRRRSLLRLDSSRRRSYESQLPSVTDDEKTSCVHDSPVDVASVLAHRRGRSASVFDSATPLPASFPVTRQQCLSPSPLFRLQSLKPSLRRQSTGETSV